MLDISWKEMGGKLMKNANEFCLLIRMQVEEVYWGGIRDIKRVELWRIVGDANLNFDGVSVSNGEVRFCVYRSNADV